MNPAIAHLQTYPFEKLAAIRNSTQIVSTTDPIDLSIGEPTHPTPDFIVKKLSDSLDTLSNYPATRGTPVLREAIRDWLISRFDLPPDSVSVEKNVLPVNGTREALFAIAQCIVDQEKGPPLVVCPNPFYQIYEGAALLAGAELQFVNCLPENGFTPDFSLPEDCWQRCQLLYLCSPGNPTGAVLEEDLLVRLMDYADRYDFVIAADECYSEIYAQEDQPPLGLLQAAARNGREDFRRCLVFHSLSKRSNAPGLRSGFVAGDANIIANFLRFRTYHGCAMPLYTQAASAAAWQDEEHVRANRAMYRRKFEAVLDILSPRSDVKQPSAGFYLWMSLPIDDVEFARGLLARHNVTILPGSFLARDAHGTNPGRAYARIALVPPLEDCVEGAKRIRDYLGGCPRTENLLR